MTPEEIAIKNCIDVLEVEAKCVLGDVCSGAPEAVRHMTSGCLLTAAGFLRDKFKIGERSDSSILNFLQKYDKPQDTHIQSLKESKKNIGTAVVILKSLIPAIEITEEGAGFIIRNTLKSKKVCNRIRVWSWVGGLYSIGEKRQSQKFTYQRTCEALVKWAYDQGLNKIKYER